MARAKGLVLLLLSVALWAALSAGAGAQSVVSVALTESPPSVTPDPASTTAGSTTFEANNVGGIPHELVIIRTELAADALPVSGDTVDLDQLEVIGDSDPFAGGESRTVNVDLTEGSYVLICNVPGHYELGMQTAFNVSGGGTDGGTTGAAPGPAVTGHGLASGVTSEPGAALLAVLALGLLTVARVATARGSTRQR